MLFEEGGDDVPTVAFAYDDGGRPTSQTDPLGRVTALAYDDEGRVNSITGPDPDGTGPLASPVESYTYNALGSLLTATDALGGVTSWQYDGLQRVTQVTEPDADDSGPLTSPVTSYTYGDHLLVSEVSDPLGCSTAFEYDGLGRIKKVTDEQDNETNYVYNGVGMLTRVTQPDPDGTGPLTAPQTTYAYDALNRLTSVTDADNGTTSYTYDTASNLLTLTDPVGNTTSYQYDGLNRLLIETNEAGDWRSYGYDPVGNLVRQQDRNGRVIRWEFDGLDQLISQQWRSGADPAPELDIETTTEGGPESEVQRVGYTGFAYGGTFTLTLDGQTAAAIAYNGTAAQVQSALEALSNVGVGDVAVTKTQDTWDAQEWKLEFQGALAGTNMAQTTIDSSNVQMFGTPVDIEATDTEGGSNPADEVQTVTLTNATGGSFRLALDGYVTAGIAVDATASQVEAALEAIASVDDVAVTGSAGGPWTVTFGGTQAGQNVSRLDGDVSQAVAGTLVRTASFTYDAAGRLTAASDPDSSYAISYDNLGRVLEVDNDGTPGVPQVVLTSSYDAAGNRTGLAATIDTTADFLNSYSYDALQRLIQVDQEGQTGGNSVAEKRVDFSYNAASQFTAIARYKDTDGGSGNEVASTAYSYDTVGRLTELAYTQGGTNLFTPYAWTYDALSSPGTWLSGPNSSPSGGGGAGATTPGAALLLGSVDLRVLATASGPVFAGLGRPTQMVGQDGTSDYGYDPTSQLTSVDHTYQTDESYSYDANGNRTMTGYQTGDDNRLTNDGTYTYQYDEEGNRTSRTNSSTGAVTEYEWDYRNRLVTVTEKDSQATVTQVVEYTYDVFDRRIGRAVDTSSPFDMADAAIERYVYDDIHNGLVSLDGSNVVLEFSDPDGSGEQSMALSKRYLYGEVVDQILAQEDVTKDISATDRVLWPLVDNLGTVRDLAKQDGTIATHYTYDSYGNVLSGDTSLTRYLFTSREWDPATELQSNRARWYDPAVGRWLSEDPLGFVAGDANVQRYVGNAVENQVDPSGMVPPYWEHPWRQFINPNPSRDPLPPFPPTGSEPGHYAPRPYSTPPGNAEDWKGRPVHVTERPNIVPAGEDGEVAAIVIPKEDVERVRKGGVKHGAEFFAPLKEGEIVGPQGCGPCVGVVIVTPDGNVAVYHFSPMADPRLEISRWRWPAKSKAAIAGGSPAAHSRRVYDWLIEALEGENMGLVGVANYNEIYWGNFGGGKEGWALPQDPGAPNQFE